MRMICTRADSGVWIYTRKKRRVNIKSYKTNVWKIITRGHNTLRIYFHVIITLCIMCVRDGEKNNSFSPFNDKIKRAIRIVKSRDTQLAARHILVVRYLVINILITISARRPAL